MRGIITPQYRSGGALYRNLMGMKKAVHAMCEMTRSRVDTRRVNSVCMPYLVSMSNHERHRNKKPTQDEKKSDE
eukprot:CAMPEP_0182464478 /NCGR_PEP_ID=MMETSP1319-20130603/8668_1 /TAXON_ID=172717 /ORGANISM="Bolidomonas pacifica, Strain RCC208" /LENGTH=73 /DNA_ID=CAMNT_0024664123 /DNA_START=340 /DNA_END=561 /DNA_ORIENTATION=-